MAYAPREEEGRVEEQVEGDGGDAEDGGVHVAQEQLVEHEVEPALQHHHQHQARAPADGRAHHLCDAHGRWMNRIAQSASLEFGDGVRAQPQARARTSALVARRAASLLPMARPVRPRGVRECQAGSR